MNDHDEGPAGTPPALPVVQHAEPQKGGSYIRNLTTGELVPNKPVPADQPEQEE